MERLLLSTPTKRSVIVRTQVLYFVTSLFIMFVIVTITGLISIQAFHGGVWGAASALYYRNTCV
jgi:ABC-2 type transport system permease protein